MSRAYPLVTAHSGCMGSPPNGREHIARALAEGADVVELDIRLASDGKVVLSHEDTISGGRSDGLLIAGHASAELAEAAASRGGELLDLDLALDILAGADCVINLDAKGPEAAMAAAVSARRRGIEWRILFSGLGAPEARAVRRGLPDFRCLLNADLLLPASGYGEEEIRAACSALTECGCCGLNLDWRAASRALMDYARPRCIPVLLWTVDEEADMQEALGLEPYSITTNRPDILGRLLGKGLKEGKAG
jgi:glycerophosphoryl diester phosphodiesterase